jgi:signal-transduction protein with cAMP-binding, CBS, and nucleotidyltransferase domain
MTKIRQLMTTDPIVLQTETSAAEAARRMRDEGVGDVLVKEGAELYGIVTDRDLVVRVVAEGADGDDVTLGAVCSSELHVLSPDDEHDAAVAAMRDHAVRRLPVVEDGTPVGIVSIGDLAVALDPDSALAQISAAPDNR